MKNVFIFLGGAAIGSVVTWKLLEKKYSDLADEEIESVIETFNRKREELESKNEEKSESYDTILEDNNYITIDENDGEVEVKTTQKTSKKSKNIKKDQIRTITADEYGELDDYGTKTWIYYADDVLSDEFDNVVETPSMFLGEALTSIDKEDDESLYVRNDILKCDYEVIKSEKNYED